MRCPSPKRTRTTSRAKSPRRLLVRLVLLPSSLLFFTSARAAADPGDTPVAIEVGARAEAAIDARLTRRLMQLEAAELDIPPPPSGPNKGRPSALFFRVLSIEPDAIRVELWERGVYYGARNVSISGASARLKARRIALAAAVLVRRLQRLRIAEARRLAELQPSPAELEAQRLGQQLRAGFGASGVAALVGPGDFWLAGPSLSGEVRLGQRARLDLGAAWLMGGAPELTGEPPLQWLELSLLPAYSAPLAARFKLLMGARFAAAAVHVSDVRAVDALPTEEDSWSARAAGVLRFEPHLGAGWIFGAGPEVGAVLRRIPVEDEARQQKRLGGLWLGAVLSLSYDRAAL